MDKIVEDDSFALFLLITGRQICDSYKKCKVVKTPFLVSKTLGAGWMFPKRSPFLPILNNYIGLAIEGGTYKRIKNSHDENMHLPDQDCLEYDGQPIQMRKAFSLFGMILGGIGLSFIIFM